jgi:hypothetical protein
MIARAGEPVIADQQAVLFYLYCDDVAAARAAENPRSRQAPSSRSRRVS